MTFGPLLLVVLTFFPAVGAISLMVLRGDDHVFIRRMALVVSTIEFLFSLALVSSKIPISAPHYALELDVPWITSPPIHFHMGVDGLSAFLVILTTFLTPIALLACAQAVACGL